MLRLLSVAGSDSGGGAGIQADLKVFAALGVHGMTAITALTAQHTRGVEGVHVVPPAFVRAQIDAVARDIGVDVAKVGMLATADTVVVVADALLALGCPIVVDPVMVATSGARLLSPAKPLFRSSVATPSPITASSTRNWQSASSLKKTAKATSISATKSKAT